MSHEPMVKIRPAGRIFLNPLALREATDGRACGTPLRYYRLFDMVRRGYPQGSPTVASQRAMSVLSQRKLASFAH